ncbi:MAG: flavin reductase family protein [Phycisphaerales bacterium]
MQFDPASLPQPDMYKLLIGAVVPRPIAFVSTLSPDGRPNLAPFSFFNAVASRPPTLLFCPANNDHGHEKDTLRNAKPVSEGGTGEFVVSIVPRAIARSMAACAEPLPYGESEWGLSKLTPVSSSVVKPARVGECHIAFECRTVQVIRLAPGEHAGGNIVIGRIVAIHADKGLINERHHVDAAMLDAIGRMGGIGYCTTRDRFEVPMGKRALTATE